MDTVRTRYRFRAYGQAGGHDTGFIEAASEADAVRQLTRSGKVPYEIRRAGGERHEPGDRVSLRTLMRPKLDLTRFFNELSVMLNSGFNVDIALRAVADAETNRSQKARLQEILAGITEGKSVADAFASQPDIPADVVALVASGENSGRMDIVVSELAKTYALRASRRSEITEALLYPSFLIFVVFCALMLLSLFLVPALQPIFENAGAEAPLIVRVLGTFGELVGNYGVLFLAVAAGAIVVLLAFMRTRSARTRLANTVARLPVARQIMRGMTRGRYLNTMALLLSNGVPMLDAMNLATRAAPAERHRAKLSEARQRVAGGEPLWQALEASDVFPESVRSLVKLGEESNNLGAMMARAGAMSEAQMQRAVSRVLTFMTPAITILLGVLVGSLVISVMTTLLSINEIAIR